MKTNGHPSPNKTRQNDPHQLLSYPGFFMTQTPPFLHSLPPLVGSSAH
jgi:hypothetical protein